MAAEKDEFGDMDDVHLVDASTRFLEEHIFVTSTQAAAIRHFEQRSVEWFAARKWRLTASTWAAAAGVSRYQTPDEMLAEKLSGSFKGNRHTERGVRCEPVAMALYVAHVQTTLPDACVDECGLMVRDSLPWLGCSPDGRRRDGQAPGAAQRAVEIKAPEKPWIDMPEEHRPQVQGECFYLGVDRCDVVLYCEDASMGEAATARPEMHIDTIAFDPEYWSWLQARLKAFYFERMLPAFLELDKTAA